MPILFSSFIKTSTGSEVFIPNSVDSHLTTIAHQQLVSNKFLIKLSNSLIKNKSNENSLLSKNKMFALEQSRSNPHNLVCTSEEYEKFII